LQLPGNRQWKHGPGVKRAGDWVGELRGAASELREFGGAGAALHGGSTMAHSGAVGGGGRRREKGSFMGVGLPL
jgi:hypothetical protein